MSWKSSIHRPCLALGARAIMVRAVESELRRASLQFEARADIPVDTVALRALVDA